jgi:hypothetical protein
MITTTQKKNTMMPGMAYPATVLALATATSYPRPSDLFAGCSPGDDDVRSWPFLGRHHVRAAGRQGGLGQRGAAPVVWLWALPELRIDGADLLMADREPPLWERQYRIGLIERDYCFHITRVGPLEEQVAQILRPSRRLGHSPSCHAPTVAPQCDIPRPADQVAASRFEQVRKRYRERQERRSTSST